MAENKAPGIENEGNLGGWDKFKNRGYWGYHEGEEGDGEEEGNGIDMGGCGTGG